MLIIPPEVTLADDMPSPMEGPPGSTLKVAYCYYNYFTLRDGDIVNTLRVEFIGAGIIGPDLIYKAVRSVIPQFGEEVLAFALYEQPVVEIKVPSEFCIKFLDQSYCWTPPFAGQVIVSAYRYVLWILSRSYPLPMAVRGLGAAAALVIILGIIAVIGMVTGIIAFATGRINWKDIREYSQDVLTAPGENIAAPIAAATWPIAAFGIAMVAMAITLPILYTRVGVTVPIGPARIEAEAAVRPPPAPPRRR